MAREQKNMVASRPLPQPQQCPECKTELGSANEAYSRIAVCDHCVYPFVWSAFNRVEHRADPSTSSPVSRRIPPTASLAFSDLPPPPPIPTSSHHQTRPRS